MTLEQRVAIVTGAGGGIGRATARRLAEDGYAVLVADSDEVAANTTVEEIHRANQHAMAVVGDVSRSDSAQTIVSECVRQFGTIHVLVNCAGVMANASIADEDPDQWQRTLDVNLTGAFMMAKYVVPVIQESGGGSLVNIASILGIQGAPMSVAYTASKGGIIAMTRALAVELAPFQIRVNAISPGTIDTPLVRRFLAHEAKNFEAARVQMTKMHPLGRIGTPRDVANAVAWLASDQSSFVTGINLIVDGGRSIATVQPRGE